MMHILSFTNKSRVVVVGAIGSKIADFADDVVSKYNNTLFLCIGDMYLGRGPRQYQDMELEYLEQICAKSDNIFCTIRGDMDNPLYFDMAARIKHMRGLNDVLRHVYFIEDYDIVSTVKGDFLCIGGGTTLGVPDSVLPVDPTTCIKNGANPMVMTFDRAGVKVIDLKPDIQEKENGDGEKIKVDENPFNNWIKLNRPTMVLCHRSPSIVTKAIVSHTEEECKNASDLASIESDYLSTILHHLSLQGAQIKDWFYSSDSRDASEESFIGTRFIPMKSDVFYGKFYTKEVE